MQDSQNTQEDSNAAAPPAQAAAGEPKDTRLIREITLKNILSFGPDTEPFELKPLNVLIGPNGGGKSNLIDCIGLMRATPETYDNDPASTISRSGSIIEWIWKGAPQNPAFIEMRVENPHGRKLPIHHRLSFRQQDQRTVTVDEMIGSKYDQSAPGPYWVYEFRSGHPRLMTLREQTPTEESRALNKGSFDPNLSILAQISISDVERYPSLIHLVQSYRKIRVYREWSLGRRTDSRNPELADSRNDILLENLSNLALRLNRLWRTKARDRIELALSDVYEDARSVFFNIEAGTVQLFLQEKWDIPRTRLSDGTLRYLCLLAILCDPDPPPLICIEEPELGLHPDIVGKLGELLVEASMRTQLIITTHSDILLEAIGEEDPTSVVVCEKHDGKTMLHRLTPEDIEPYKENYRLGDLWLRGGIGGTRW